MKILQAVSARTSHALANWVLLAWAACVLHTTSKNRVQQVFGKFFLDDVDSSYEFCIDSCFVFLIRMK
jgi:hypothetical protein